MMTKHLTSAKLDGNLSRVNIGVLKGKSEKTAKLYLLDKFASSEFVAIRRKFEGEQGGDRCISRGSKRGSADNS